jgi:arylsulfatase A-like enzyme
VRIPLLVHLPASLRDRFAWDPARVAFTTDLTPTLYQLLGEAPQSPGDGYGEPLARIPGAPVPPPRDRMIASSYGAVYGAVMQGGTRMYVVDAIERRELAFAFDPGAAPGRAIPADAATRREGTDVITATVRALAGAYKLPAQ